MISLTLPDPVARYAPEELLHVDVAWDFEQPVEMLEVRLVCNTAGKGDRDLQIVENWRMTNPSPSGHESLEIPLPQAPYSFSGKLISVIWAIEAISFPQEETTRQEFILAPGGQEILLPEADQEDQAALSFGN